MPSKTRIAAEKYKTKPINKPHPVRNPSHANILVTMTLIASTCTTSTATTTKTMDAVPSTSGTQMVAATSEETKRTFDHLLNLGETADFDDDNENAGLVPLVPLAPQPQQDATQQNPNTVMLPLIIGTAIKIETPHDMVKKKDTTEEKKDEKKKTFVTVEYMLKCKYVKTTCKFPCGRCTKVFANQCEVNEHFRTNHSPVKCDYCEKYLDTPAAMLRHRY